MNKIELAKCAEAKSDQIDADNLIGGITMDVTIKTVQRGPSNEQPLQLVLEETDKFYRPSKTFRRALIGCFGDEPANWIGQRIRLIRNPDTTFGGVKVGGIEVSHASIPAPIVLMLSTKRGKKSAVSIDVIPPIQKPVPMPSKVKEAAAAITKPARGTISGDALESDLTGVGEDRPVDEVTKGKVINAFAAIGYDQPKLEAEYGKKVSIFVESDVKKARVLLNAIKNGISKSFLESEFGKPMSEWVIPTDIDDAEKTIVALKITAAQAKAAADTDTGEV